MTQQELKELLNYDSKTGKFTWINRKSRTDFNGKEAGYLHGSGYVRMKVSGKEYKAHRLAWLYIFGEFPSIYIDHINGIKTDNRIVNLREATPRQNQYNAKTRADSTSKIKGVAWHKATQKWMVRLRVAGKEKHIGLFQELQDAVLAIKEARNKYHGEYAHHG